MSNERGYWFHDGKRLCWTPSLTLSVDECRKLDADLARNTRECRIVTGLIAVCFAVLCVVFW